MADSNWIKVNRNVWGNFIWDFENPKYGLAWIDMLLMANYKDKKILFDGSVKTIKRGSFVTSMVKLAERWQMDRRAVKKFFDVLQDEGMITYECTNRCTTVNIVKYELYQGFNTTECTTECTTDAQQNVQQMYSNCTQHKKVKKEKESKEGKERINYQKIVNMYNNTCKSLPKVTILSDARKKAIKARFNTYSYKQFQKLFNKAEASDFLKGKSKSNFQANFDWLIKDANMAKTLDGNFDNKSAQKQQVVEQQEQNKEFMDLIKSIS